MVRRWRQGVARSKSRKGLPWKTSNSFPPHISSSDAGPKSRWARSWQQLAPSGCLCTSAAAAPWPPDLSTAWAPRWMLRASSTWNWAACARTPRSCSCARACASARKLTSTGFSLWAAARLSTPQRPSPTALAWMATCGSSSKPRPPITMCCLSPWCSPSPPPAARPRRTRSSPTTSWAARPGTPTTLTARSSPS